MTQAPPAIFKIPTKSPQPARKAPRPARRANPGRPAPGRVLANGTGRAATRGGGEVIELEYGIAVYPAREEKGRWRAVWYENGQRQQCEAGTQEKLAARLEKVTERLAAGAPDMKRPGAALIAHYLDPDRLPSTSGDVGELGRALAAGLHGERDKLMANTVAYSGLRWGELTALTIAQVDQAARVITVDRKVVEVAGHLYVEPPKCRKYRRTIYPCRTPAGYPLAERLAARIEAARAGQAAGTNPLGLIFPSPAGKHWRSSNFNRSVLRRAYLAAGWRDGNGNGRWTWHSLRHVFCTTALLTWKLDPTDVSRMAGHANYRITLDMYVGSTAGVLDRARQATD